MRNRTWFHRGVAAALGLVFCGVVSGAKIVRNHEQQRERQAHRERAVRKAAAYFTGQGDTASAQAIVALSAWQQQIESRPLRPADVDYLLGIAQAKPAVDQLVSARALALLVGLKRQGKLDAGQSEKVKLANRSLFHHPGFVVRVYALGLAAELKDTESAALISELAKDDPDPFVREQAEKTRVKLGIAGDSDGAGARK